MAKKTLTLDKEKVKHIAKLVNITLSDEEIEKYSKELTQTLNYIENLENLDTKDVEPTYQTTGITNRFLNEKAGERTLPQKKALKNAAKSKNGYFQIQGMEYGK